MSQWVNFQEVRQRVSLHDVIVKLYAVDNLKRQGNKLIGPCPVHGGDSPRSFHADLEKNIWHCFSKCQRGGNQLDFVALRDGISIRDAALKLQSFFLADGAAAVPPSVRQNEDVRRAAETPPRSAAASAPERNAELKVNLSLKGDHPHLVDDRALATETIERFGVGYCSQGVMRGCIAIPVHDEDGVLVAYAGRRLKPQDIREHGKYKFPTGFRKELVLYNLHRAREHAAERGLVLVEGFFSVLKLYEAGFPNAVASMGCELSDHQAELLATGPEVIVLYDGDEAGRAGSRTACEKLAGRVKTRLAVLPDDTSPDDLPAKALRWLVNGMQALDLGRETARPRVPAASSSGSLARRWSRRSSAARAAGSRSPSSDPYREPCYALAPFFILEQV